MKEWMKKWSMLLQMPNLWFHQYMLLDYVDNNAFTGVMKKIDMEKLSLVVGNLLNEKTARTGRVETIGGRTSFLAADVFVDDTIWVGSSQASTQYILNIANVKDVSLLINGLPISIAKKGESYKYLGIFLFIKSLSKPSLAQAYRDVKFFSNVVLRKAIMDKQFSYLVLAFSFVSLGVYRKWDVMIWKGLKAKAVLLCDFPNEILHHPFLYGLKSFEQIQSEGKLAFLIFFSNKHGILGRFFEHRFLDLQVLGWSSLNFLQYPVKLHVSFVNNFLAGIVKIFLENELSLMNNLPNAFCESCRFLIFNILGNSMYYDSVLSLKHFDVAFGNKLLDKKGVQWKRLDFKDPVLHWFILVFEFMNNVIILALGSAISSGLSVLDVLDFNNFSDMHNSLLDVWLDYVEVYTDGSLKGAGSAKVTCGAAAYFPVANVSIGVRVFGLLSSTLAELQAIVLALKCVLASCDASLSMPDFHNQCWIKQLHVKEHSGVLGNVKTNELVNKAIASSFTLPVGIQEQFLVAEGTVVFEAGPGYDVIPSVMLKEVDWVVTVNV
ncbi:hypothetical protein G9A89_021754 [Geosiphon pyriformis]|nr:hypothetical protein G9A89_021754 [Geosiphon pyriformis]